MIANALPLPVPIERPGLVRYCMDAALGATPVPFSTWQCVAATYDGAEARACDRQIFNAILPRTREGLGATDVRMGLVAAVFTACFGVLVPVAGWLGDRVSRKWLVCSSLPTGISGGLVGLILFRSLATGAGESFFTPPAVSLIGEHHNGTPSLATAIYQTSQYVGVAVSSWVAAALAEHFGWRAAFYTFGGFGLVLLGVPWWRLENDVPAVATVKGAETAAAVPGAVVNTPSWRVPSFLLLTAAFAGMVFTMVGFMTWMPTLLQTKSQPAELESRPRALGPAPRLFASAADWAALLARLKTDPVAAAIYRDARRRAVALLAGPLLEHKLLGQRRLTSARLLIGRVLDLATVARVDGDARAAARAREELLADPRATFLGTKTVVAWQWLTRAEAKPGDRVVSLRQDGATLRLRVLSPGAVKIEVEDVSEPAHPFEEANPGLRVSYAPCFHAMVVVHPLALYLLFRFTREPLQLSA